MPRRVYVSGRPSLLFEDDLVRAEPYATAGYNPDAISPLDDPDAGVPTTQPATVHRDLGPKWEELYGTRWDIDANLAPKLRSAPGGRVPRPGDLDYDGTRPAGAPAAFYGGLIRPVFAPPAAGYMFELNVQGGADNDSYGLAICFRFDPATGTGFALTFGAPNVGSPPRDLVWMVAWEIDHVVSPLTGLSSNDLRIVCRDGYQGVFEIGRTLNGAPHPGRTLAETFETGHDGTTHGIYVWDRDGRYTDGGGEQILARPALGGGTRSLRIYEAPPQTAVRVVAPAGETLRLVAEGTLPADDQVASVVGTGVEQALPLDPIVTWRPEEITIIEVEDDAGFQYYHDETAASQLILPGSLLTFAEETTLGLPTDPVTGEPLVPVEAPPDPVPSSWRNLQAEFETDTHGVDGASTSRRPDAISPDYLTAHTLGPVAISDTADGVAAWAWEVWADNDAGEVRARRANAAGDGWDADVLLFSFSTANPIVELDVAFNQNGRPEVATERADGHLWHYYFHAVDAIYRFDDFGPGRTPRVLLDEPWNIPGSEVMILYMDDAADMMRFRLQSDRYLTAYDTPLRSVANAYLEDVVRTYGYRIQIRYTVRWPADGYWDCRSFVTALYPVPMLPEGAEFSFAPGSMAYVPVELGDLDTEGAEIGLGLASLGYVQPLTPELAIEGAEWSFGNTIMLLQPIVPDLATEGAAFSFAFAGASYVPLIEPDLRTEGVEFGYGFESATLGP